MITPKYIQFIVMIGLSTLFVGCKSIPAKNKSPQTPITMDNNKHNIIQKMQEAQTAYDRGQWEIAYKSYTALSLLMPDDAYTFFRLGNIALRRNTLDKAIDAFKKAIELNPQFIEAKNNLSISYLLLADKSYADIQNLLPQNQHTNTAFNTIQVKRNLIDQLLETPFEYKSPLK